MKIEFDAERFLDIVELTRHIRIKSDTRLQVGAAEFIPDTLILYSASADDEPMTSYRVRISGQRAIRGKAVSERKHLDFDLLDAHVPEWVKVLAERLENYAIPD